MGYHVRVATSQDTKELKQICDTLINELAVGGWDNVYWPLGLARRSDGVNVGTFGVSNRKWESLYDTQPIRGVSQAEYDKMYGRKK